MTRRPPGKSDHRDGHGIPLPLGLEPRPSPGWSGQLDTHL